MKYYHIIKIIIKKIKIKLGINVLTKDIRYYLSFFMINIFKVLYIIIFIDY